VTDQLARAARPRSDPRGPTDRFEVAVIGAGLGGLCVAHRLDEIGVHDVAIFERDEGVGGTWRANGYPGAACDVPSHLYSLSFAPNPHWSSTYAGQPEILSYIEDCYDRFAIREKVRLSTSIDSARWSDERQSWTLSDSGGEEYEATILVSAIGLFNTLSEPVIEGIRDFGGTVFHSSRWDASHDLTGRRVAVIGTGATAIQVVPAIAERTEHLDVYQRTPAWILPRKNELFTDEQKRAFAADEGALRGHRDELYELFEQNTAFISGSPFSELLAEVARSYLERKVPDPELRARLTPDYPLGCKRVLVSSDFYPAIQRRDVELVTDRIERITPGGILTSDGRLRECDTIVLCTGFRASEYLSGIDVVGRNGERLHDAWSGVPRGYLGMAVPGFPNFFMLYGPNTNQGGNSIILILEGQAQFVAATVESMRALDASSVDVLPESMQSYMDELAGALEKTVWRGGCASYFRADGGQIVTQLPHTSKWYCDRTMQFHPDDFEITRQGSAGLSAMGDKC
jgi:cation diffusion facilitator CzcD-associated flavoprotein CzcO